MIQVQARIRSRITEWYNLISRSTPFCTLPIFVIYWYTAILGDKARASSSLCQFKHNRTKNIPSFSPSTNLASDIPVPRAIRIISRITRSFEGLTIADNRGKSRNWYVIWELWTRATLRARDCDDQPSCCRERTCFPRGSFLAAE